MMISVTEKIDIRRQLTRMNYKRIDFSDMDETGQYSETWLAPKGGVLYLEWRHDDR